MGRIETTPGRGDPPPGRVRELLVACVRAGDVDGAGFSLRAGAGQSEPVLGTDAVAETLEQLQFTLGEGPCFDASASGSPVLVPDLADADLAARWPMFLHEATRHHVGAIFAFPLRIGAIALGAADLYRRSPGPLGREQLAGVLQMIDVLTLALIDVDSAPPATLGGESLAMSVHRAAGMLMAQLDSSIDEALARLRAVAFAEGIAIDELANQVVEGRRRFEKEQP